MPGEPTTPSPEKDSLPAPPEGSQRPAPATHLAGERGEGSMAEVPATPSPESHSRAASPEGSQPPAPAPHDRSRLKKILTPLVLFAMGVLLGLVAYFVVYPSPETGISAPPYAHIEIVTSVPVSTVAVGMGQVTHGVAKINVLVNLANGVSPPPAGAEELIGVALPVGTTFYDCHANCTNYTSIYQSAEARQLTFKSGTASALFGVNAANFGVNFDGIDAYAAIPEVTLKLQGPGSENPTFLAAFSIPSAASYDWSSFQTEEIKGSFIAWKEALASSDTAGRTTVGIDHAREANDETLNFLAGALIGLAGAAILAAIQEALHAFD